MTKIDKKPKIKNQIPLISIVEDYFKSKYDIRFNEVSNQLEIKSKDEIIYRNLNEDNLYRELQNHNIKFSINNITSLLRSDFVDSYNPFKNYFEALPKWNQKTDYIEELANYVKAVNQERFNRHFKKMLVRIIACSLIDGYFNKQAFVLVHEEQNSGKSTFCRWLCPKILNTYIAENLSIDKDSHIALCENLIINIDELSTLQKTEINGLKSLFSKVTVKVRRPFDKKPTMAQRRASFVGSTNNIEFLTDETGSVRWLCFEIEKIDWNYSKQIDIDLIYSQAFFLFNDGFKYDLTKEEIAENEKENEKHQIVTIDMEIIMEYFSPATKEEHDDFLTASQIMEKLTEMGASGFRLNQYTIGKTMKKLKFKRDQKFTGLYQNKGYYLKFNKIKK